MAELYRRIRRVSYRVLTLCALTTPAFAVAKADADLVQLAGSFGSSRAAERERAWARYRQLQTEDLPAVQTRLEHLLEHHEPEPAQTALRSFRHAVGSRRADDRVDIAPGVLPVLGVDREPPTVRTAEMLLLMRALERMGTREAGTQLVRVFAHDWALWRFEARRVVDRLGSRAIPVLIRARGHPRRGIRGWAHWGLRALKAQTPGDALSRTRDDPALLAETLRAYGARREMEAMEIVATYTTDPRRGVRDAARWATQRYGPNAKWQVRRRYRMLTGRPPPRSWNWRRTMEALFSLHDQRRLAEVHEALRAGAGARRRGDLSEMRRRFDEALAAAPDLPLHDAKAREQLAEGYAAAGYEALVRKDLRRARGDYRRAVHLFSDHPRSRHWRAQLAYLRGLEGQEGELASLNAHREAVALWPGHRGATAALDRLMGNKVRRSARRRRWAMLLGALLLALGAVLILRPGRGPRFEEDREPTTDEIDTAPDTA